jgi:ABC-type antimicrobial peptide transport system permease subunit
VTVGRALLVGRLALRDLRRRRAEAVLLLLAILAATTTLTLGLVLGGVTDDPYHATRDATAGPDVVANVGPPIDGGPSDLASLEALIDEPGVVGHSGPYPVISAELATNDVTSPVQAEGRDTTAASVDQPELTEGRWVNDGEVVVEAAFADALGLHAGDQITLDGRPFRIAGVAVTAAIAGGTAPMYTPGQPQEMEDTAPGLVWLTQPDVRDLAADDTALSYVLNLRLADPDTAQAFVDERTTDTGPGDPSRPRLGLESWQEILDNANNITRNARNALLTGAWLLGVLAVAGVAVLVGGRLADQTRRVGLLKAVGGTPGLVVAVLLAEYLVVAVVAAVAGLAVGRLVAPLLSDPSVGLLGQAPEPSLGLSTVVVVIAMALGVGVVATLVPAIRASRSSTIRALDGSARPPRRWAALIALSARLPIPLLLGLRVAARRPRRMVLAIASIAVTVTGIVAVLSAHAQLDGQESPASPSAFDQLRTDRLNSVLLVITVMLVALAVVNAIFITWATVLDSRQASALARALGVTPREVSAGLAAAQALPALAGAVLGIPAGIALFSAAATDDAPAPPLWVLIALVPATAVAIALLTSIPARLAARQPIAEALDAEPA